MEKKLNIAILGYGKMGKEIEKIANERGHQVICRIDSEEDWISMQPEFANADVALEFTTPETVVANLRKCFDAGIPVIVGTTGWYQHFDEIRNECLNKGQALFFSSNFSLSVNIFFEINRLLAKLMNPYKEYEVNIEEVHHVQKIDAPSGTAISLANDIIRLMEHKEKWVSDTQKQDEAIAIRSVRTENVPGTHIVTYDSVNDAIELKHTAKNRRGFALGAIFAAEWLREKKGYMR